MICKICSRQAASILNVKGVPSLQNILMPSAKEAAGLFKIDADFLLCEDCNHITIAKSEKSELFTKLYNNDATTSPSIQKHHEAVADQVSSLAVNRDCRIIEIGCGRGELLHEIRRRGFKNITGYDPTAPNTANGMIVQDYWRPESNVEKYDIVILRHTLEEVADPITFMADVRAIVRTGGKVYVELTNNYNIYAKSDPFSLYAECNNLFSYLSISKFFLKTQMNLFEVKSYFGGNWFGVWATLAETPAESLEHEIEAIRAAVRRLPKPILLWGAGGRGCNILNYCGFTRDDILAVVDVDRAKAGRYIGGTAHPVIHPDQVIECSPKSVLIANSIYAEEVKSLLPSGCVLYNLNDLRGAL